MSAANRCPSAGRLACVVLWALALCAPGASHAAANVVTDGDRLSTPRPRDAAEAARLSKQYLRASGTEKEALARRLKGYAGPIEPVLRSIADSRKTQWTNETGVLKAQHFSAPELRARYKDDLLYFVVPERYDRRKPWPLLIFMHGGNANVARTAAGWVVDPAYGLKSHIEDAPFITVAPSARCKGKQVRWNQPEVEDYLTAVVRECQYRYHIDRDRVFLGGQSLGGFGAYHWCQRIADKIAGGILCAGSWRTTNWRCAIGTPLFIVHGKHDSTPKGRPRYTDVFFARAAARLLKEAGADVTYLEHGRGHGLSQAGDSLAHLVAWMDGKRRDPFYPRVVAVTRKGWNALSDPPAPHHRWVSILETGDGKIEFAAAKFTGPGIRWGQPTEDWQKQKWVLTTTMAKAGLVEAIHKGGNLFDVKTQNVRKFSLWLHPKMVDFAKPLIVNVDGRRSLHKVTPSLSDALRSFERRRDWGLIYHAELVLRTK